MHELVVLCADIGAVSAGNFAWAGLPPAHGADPLSLVHHAAKRLNLGQPVALGFECPLFVPLVDDPASLTRARPGEGARPWSAGAGSGSLATGLVEVAWVLRELRRQVTEQPAAHLHWPSFAAAGCGLFVWEAFVSAGGKRASHLQDAQAAVDAFEAALPTPDTVNAVKCTSEVYSLIGAALLRTGWSSELAILREPCLVIKVGECEIV